MKIFLSLWIPLIAMFLFCAGLKINFDQSHYFFTEGMVSGPEIKVQFKRTQNSFTLTLYPVSLIDAVDKFHVENFIVDPPQLDVERATAGKIIRMTIIIIQMELYEVPIMHAFCLHGFSKIYLGRCCIITIIMSFIFE